MQIGYALVLGNIMHNVFEQTLQLSDVSTAEHIEQTIRKAMRDNYT